MFEGFSSRSIDAGGVAIHARVGGRGAPLLLLHGHPQTHVMWHRVAVPLARRFSVVAMDLRGYGDSARVPPDAGHAAYSKRAMALDAVAVMRALGFERFSVCAHDRGARVAHRLALDHPRAVRQMVLLDIAPTLAMYTQTTEAFARAYWHWFFLIRPAPLPEEMIGADPATFWRRKCAGLSGSLDVFAPEAIEAYISAFCDPAAIHASCEDYRAAATVDIDHDNADDGRKMTQPLHVLWGGKGAIEAHFDCLALWRERAEKVTGHVVDAGHYIPEERPDVVIAEALRFFGA